MPHHVTQRGNRGLETFFAEPDYRAYVSLLAASSAKAGCEIWAYCLMPDHVHLVMVPGDEDALRAALGEAHRRYTRRINLREGSARADAATSGRSAFTLFPWTRPICSPARAMSS